MFIDYRESALITCMFSVPKPRRTPARHLGKSSTARNKPGPERMQNKAVQLVLNSDAVHTLNKEWSEPIINNGSGFNTSAKTSNPGFQICAKSRCLPEIDQ